MAKGAATVTVRITGDASNFNKVIGESEDRLGTFGGKVSGAIGGLGKAALIGAGAVGGLAAAVGKQAVDAFQEAQRVGAQTDAVIKSTGGAAGVTAGQVDDLANKIALAAGVMDDEAVKAGENMLLTFTNVQNRVGDGNDIFNQATQTMADMSVALGQDATQSAMQLGKALNDPIQGVSALRRVGVTFTEDQEKQIKALQESGDVMGAQKIILAELNKEFGGSAAAAGGTLAGALGRLKTIWGNLLEEVGEKFAPVIIQVSEWLGQHLPAALDTASRWWGTLSAVVGPVVQTIGNVAKQIGNLIDVFRGGDDVAQGVGEIADNMLGNTGKFVEFFQTLTQTVQNGLNFVRDLWAAHGAEIVLFLTNTWAQLQGIFSSAFDAISAVITVFVNIATNLWERFGSHIIEHVMTAFNLVKDFIGNVLDVVHGVFEVFAGIFTGDWSRVWEGIKEIFGGVWGAIGDIIRSAINIVSTVIGAGMALVSSLWSTAWHAIHTALEAAWENIKRAIGAGIDAAVEFVKGLPRRWLDSLGNLGRLLWDAGSDLIGGLIRGIEAKAGELLDTIKRSVTDKLPGFVKNALGIASPSKVFEQLGREIPAGLAAGITGGARMVEKAMAAVTPTGAAMSPAGTLGFAGGYGTSAVTYAPVITINGAADPAGARRAFEDSTSAQFDQLLRQLRARGA